LQLKLLGGEGFGDDPMRRAVNTEGVEPTARRMLG
jgi:hypothetical protein